MKTAIFALREARKRQHLSQQKLAQKAGLSLATIQNIETGKGNPALSTFQAILSALSLEIELRPQQIDFDILAQLGVPLLSSKSLPAMRLYPAFLIDQLFHLASSIDNIEPQSREAKALAAFFCAIRDHYPSVWNQLNTSIKQWLKSYPEEISPKLRRISLQKLSTYL